MDATVDLICSERALGGQVLNLVAGFPVWDTHLRQGLFLSLDLSPPKASRKAPLSFAD